MREWLLRPYPHDKLRTDEFLQGRLVAIGWPFIKDASELSEEELEESLKKQYPDWDAKRIGNGVNCIHNFAQDMEIGDLVLVVPKKSDFNGYVLFAEVTGGYEYDSTLASSREGYPHQRKVRWIRPRISRKQLPEAVGGISSRRGTTLIELPEGTLSTHAREMSWID